MDLVFSCTDIIDGIAVFYGLDNTATDMLELSYTTFIGNGDNTKEVKLENEANIDEVEFRMDSNKDIPVTPLTVDDLKLKFRYQIGNIVDRGCSYDSTYMITVM